MEYALRLLKSALRADLNTVKTYKPLIKKAGKDKFKQLRKEVKEAEERIPDLQEAIKWIEMISE